MIFRCFSMLVATFLSLLRWTKVWVKEEKWFLYKKQAVFLWVPKLYGGFILPSSKKSLIGILRCYGPNLHIFLSLIVFPIACSVLNSWCRNERRKRRNSDKKRRIITSNNIWSMGCFILYLPHWHHLWWSNHFYLKVVVINVKIPTECNAIQYQENTTRDMQLFEEYSIDKDDFTHRHVS